MGLRGFGSDNFSGVLPEVFKALEESAFGHQHSYGKDKYTAKAIEDFKQIFGDDVDVYFVYNGTGANILRLSLIHIMRSFVRKQLISTWTSAGLSRNKPAVSC